MEKGGDCRACGVWRSGRLALALVLVGLVWDIRSHRDFSSADVDDCCGARGVGVSDSLG